MAIPHRLGRYVVRRRIGSGGFATVWLAYDEELDSPVAVKVLADNWTEDAHVRRRFAEEGRYLRKVESPHVVSVYDAGSLDDGRPYLVMSYADQGTLADRLDDGTGLTTAQAWEVVRQVGAGLQALHDRDILHRDVKPANVLFRSVPAHGEGPREDEVAEVRAMLGDLGLGKALDVSSRLTLVAGTPSYVAPEQARAEDLDARADQYSLAALTHLLLSGRPPFRHADLAAAAEPPDPAPLSTDERAFSPAVERVVRRGLSPDRADRFGSVTAFVDALGDALSLSFAEGRGAAAPWLGVDPDLTRPGPRPSPAPTSAAPRPAAAPGRRRGVLVVAGVLAALVGLGAGYAAHGATVREVTVTDDTRQLQVTVPAEWDGAQARTPWQPPSAEGAGGTEPALSVGATSAWATDGGQGVFVGLLPGTALPSRVPQHPECTDAGSVVRDGKASPDGEASMTVVFTGCPGGLVVERVVQVASNLLLWVQIRSETRGTATDVLASVTTRGL